MGTYLANKGVSKDMPQLEGALLDNFQAVSKQMAWVGRADSMAKIGIWSLKKRITRIKNGPNIIPLRPL